MDIPDPRVRYSLLVAATILVACTIYAIEHSGHKSNVPEAPVGLPVSEQKYETAPDFAGATGWHNTPNNASLDLVGLRGKVVVVDFWTYSCINCLHTLPHVTRLYDTYAPYGLVVVGVHTPEFGFEKVRSNVAGAIPRYGIHYPVAQDNDYGIWEAYHNHYWPAHYVIDQYGKIRDTHIGEGDYEAAEQTVRDLLTEAGATHLPAPIEGSVPDVESGAHTQELYVVTRGRDVALANPEGIHRDQNVMYARTQPAADGDVVLSGTWAADDQRILAQSNGTVQVRFHGMAANIVAGGPPGACVAVNLDGAPIDASMAGPDVAVAQGGARACLRMDGLRSYDVYAGPRSAHVLELVVPAGFEVYTLDFT